MKPILRLTVLPLLLLSLLHSAALPGVAAEKRRYVAVGGEAFGIKLYTSGVLIVDLDSVETANGSATPAASAGLKRGDRITAINGAPVQNAQQLTAAVAAGNGKPLALTVERNGTALHLNLLPARAADGSYRAGLWVRDSAAGIGTLTFQDNATGIFAGLGHGVCDVDTGQLMPLADGEAVLANVSSFYKSSAGKPGELCGVFTKQVLGDLLRNGETGVYGAAAQPSDAKMLPVARPAEIRTGQAQMITTIDAHGPQAYDIEITRVFTDAAQTRNLIVRIVDPALLSKTGGILQGMSGSPIVQNSMLVGAVTHVFVNDPTQGYAIFAQTMLETADALAAQQQAAA